MYKNKIFEQYKTSKTDHQHLIDLPNAFLDKIKAIAKEMNTKDQKLNKL